MTYTIKVDEQGKLYWWDGTQWIEIAEKDATIDRIVGMLPVHAWVGPTQIGDLQSGIYTIEADGRFEVRPQYSEPSDFPAKWKDGNPKTEHSLENFHRQLAYWITDKHEEK